MLLLFLAPILVPALLAQAAPRFSFPGRMLVALAAGLYLLLLCLMVLIFGGREAFGYGEYGGFESFPWPLWWTSLAALAVVPVVAAALVSRGRSENRGSIRNRPL